MSVGRQGMRILIGACIAITFALVVGQHWIAAAVLALITWRYWRARRGGEFPLQ